MHDYADDNANEDFDEELKSMPNFNTLVLPVYSFERLESGIRYLTMKEIEGQTLKESFECPFKYSDTTSNRWFIAA